MSRALNRALLKHEVMPDVEGSPIVESGSNSDGEWVRWADGTQMCLGVVNGNATGTKTYAQAFVSPPRNTGGTNNNANSVVDSWGVYTTSDEISFTYRWGSRTDAEANYAVSGRWK